MLTRLKCIEELLRHVARSPLVLNRQREQVVGLHTVGVVMPLLVLPVRVLAVGVRRELCLAMRHVVAAGAEAVSAGVHHDALHGAVPPLDEVGDGVVQQNVLNAPGWEGREKVPT